MCCLEFHEAETFIKEDLFAFNSYIQYDMSNLELNLRLSSNIARQLGFDTTGVLLSFSLNSATSMSIFVMGMIH